MRAVTRRLRWLVVWSSRGPLARLYRRLYRAAIAGTTRLLGRYRSVVAIYLIRGAAKDGLTPGVSDIDLVVVTADESEIAAIRRTFRTLGTATRHTIDYNPAFLHSLDTLRHRWRTVPVWQSMYLAGRTTWKLLHGSDVLAELPALDEMQRRGCCHAEMNHWWLLFARQVLTSPASQSDVVMVNSVAYKATTRLHAVFLRVAKRAGYACKENRTYWLTEFGPRLALPEIALCPAALQLPDAPDMGRRHLDDPVDLDRDEEPLTAEIDPEKPLVYCSLGGAAGIYPHAERFVRAVVAVSHARSDWQLVLHLGTWHGPSLPPAPANLIVRERVPQLALLRRAAVMVTHGGINSITECLHFGVPMVVIPGLRDQPGNAVRAVHHGLALSAPMAEITAEHLASLIDRAMTDEGLRHRLERLRRALEAADDLEPTLVFLERAARPGRDVADLSSRGASDTATARPRP